MSSTLEYTTSVVISACVVAVFAAIAADFYLYHKKSGAKKEMHSVVATASMVAFYMAYVLLLKLDFGRWSSQLQIYQTIVGLAAMVIGAIVNIVGRMQLKGNWADQIKIYKDHKLVTKGIYAYIRHPLYSSIILMLYGGAVIYSSWLHLLLVTVIFIPAMTYRAGQEEKLLSIEFPEYVQYKKQAGMYLPKQLRGDRHV